MIYLAVILVIISGCVGLTLYNSQDPSPQLIIMNFGIFIAAQIAFFSAMKRRK